MDGDKVVVYLTTGDWTNEHEDLNRIEVRRLSADYGKRFKGGTETPTAGWEECEMHELTEGEYGVITGSEEYGGNPVLRTRAGNAGLDMGKITNLASGDGWTWRLGNPDTQPRMRVLRVPAGTKLEVEPTPPPPRGNPMTDTDTAALFDEVDPAAERSARDPLAVTGGTLFGPSPPPKEKAPRRDTALLVDAWTRRQGAEAVAEEMKGKTLLKLSTADEAAAADLYAACFDPDPRPNPAECDNPAQKAFIDELLAEADTAALRQNTVLNPDACDIAAPVLYEQYKAYLKTCEKQAKEGGKTGPKMTPAPGAGAAKTAIPPTPSPAAARAAAKAAAAKAEEEVSAATEAERLLGGTAGNKNGDGSPPTSRSLDGMGSDRDIRLDKGRLADLHRRLRKSPALKRICELAGRFRRMAAGVQRDKCGHGQDEVLGVEPTGDLAKLVPMELSRLADDSCPQAELDQLRRLAERLCTGRELRAAEPVGKGPVVITVDESGSMSGEKVYTAKALALALAWVAHRQRRWCVLVAYTGRLNASSKYYGRNPRVLDLRPGRAIDPTAVAEWLEAFMDYGSMIDIPIRELPRVFETLNPPKGRTDIVIVTDAKCSPPADVIDRFNAWRKQQNAKVTALVVGGSPGDTLEPLCDKVLAVNAINASDEAAAEIAAI